MMPDCVEKTVKKQVKSMPKILGLAAYLIYFPNSFF
jgi:hypothetical protein